ncbi:MAG: hypothetical protein M3N95_04285 [Actinomycetota bacterium]|nr:hypothetical protein [Actinomycetota bacterium]
MPGNLVEVTAYAPTLAAPVIRARQVAAGRVLRAGQVAAGRVLRAGHLAGRAPAISALVVLVTISDSVTRWVVSNPDAWEQWASTNLVNLHRHPLTALFASAFVSPDVLGTDLLILAVAGILLESRVGWRRTLGVAAAGHVLATLITEGAVLLAILSGNEARQAAWQLDVGISYVTWTVLGASLLFVPRPWRGYAVTAALGYLVVQLTFTWDMTAWGHVTSLVIGLLSWPLLKAAPKRNRV